MVLNEIFDDNSDCDGNCEGEGKDLNMAVRGEASPKMGQGVLPRKGTSTIFLIQ
jgi:hypothetical protein